MAQELAEPAVGGIPPGEQRLPQVVYLAGRQLSFPGLLRAVDTAVEFVDGVDQRRGPPDEVVPVTALRPRFTHVTGDDVGLRVQQGTQFPSLFAVRLGGEVGGAGRDLHAFP